MTRHRAEIAKSLAAWNDPKCTEPFIKGRVALHAILLAAGIGPGDEVVVPGFTCIVVPAAITYTGAKPVYYDVDPTNLQGNEILALDCLTDRTRAVIVQHNFGIPAPCADIVATCRQRGILVIEDCAHAMGASIGGRPLGTLGDAAFASLQWSKPVSTGLGGVARVNSPVLLERLRRVCQTAFAEPSYLKSFSLWMLSKLYRDHFSTGLFWKARSAYGVANRIGLVPGSSEPSELEAGEMPTGYRERFGRVRLRSLRAALTDLPASVEHRRKIASLYERWLTDEACDRMPDSPGAISTWLRFPLLIENRDSLLDLARANRIEIGDWFSAPLHPAGSNAAAFGYEPGLCPVSDSVAARIINLPTHSHVSPEQARIILDFVLAHGRLVYADQSRTVAQRAPDLNVLAARRGDA